MECKVCMGAQKVHGRCTKGAWRCAEGCAGGARARAEWAGGAGVGGAGPVQRKSKVENFRKCACFDRAYHENLTWRGLMGVAQGHEVCGGGASWVWRAVAARVVGETV